MAKKSEDRFDRLLIRSAIWTARPDSSLDFIGQRWLDYAGITLEQSGGGVESNVIPTIVIRYDANGELRWRRKALQNRGVSEGSTEVSLVPQWRFPLFDDSERIVGGSERHRVSTTESRRD